MHAAAGLGATILVSASGWLPLIGVLVSLAIGVTHEFDQDPGRPFSDFRPRRDGAPNGWPWNGLLDVVTFCAPAVCWWAYRLIIAAD